jgi:insulysin
VVWSGIRVSETTLAYRVIIQSEKTPEYLESRIDAFLESYEKTIGDMTETDFEGHKRSLITKRLEKLKNLSQESGRLWSHIDGEYFDFELGKSIPRNYICPC